MISTALLGVVVFLAIVTSAGVAYLSHDRNAPMSVGLTITAAGVTGTSIVDFVERFVWSGVLLDSVGMTMGVLIVFGWVYLIANYTENEWAVRDGRIYVLAAPMVALVGLHWLEAIHATTSGTGAIHATTGSTGGLLVQDYGPFLSIYNLYSYAVTAVTIVALAVRFRNERPIYRRRAAILAFAPLPPAIIAAAFLIDSVPLATDLTPVGYALTTLIALYALRQYHLLEIVPLARETTVNNIEDGVIAVTSDGVIASVNDPGKAMLYVTDDVIGSRLDEGLAGWPPIVEAVEKGVEEQVRVDDTHVKVSLTPIEKQDVRLGTVVQLKDVTEEVERREELQEKQRELERTNEQLNDFASVVSHDIRNPLTVAQGNLELLAADVDDDEPIEVISEAHERIEALTDDVLALAREGRRVAETSTVDFEGVARSARDSTNLSADAFDCSGPSTVVADRSRLQQLLENLFRNALEHGGPNVAVHVGELEDEEGFFVADDGPGIPEGERSEVFEYGYTNSETGTGLGLNIVRSIAEAHDWTVRIVDGLDGGTRFEFVTGDADAEALSETETTSEAAPRRSGSSTGT